MKVGVIAIDGTKIRANAADRNRSYVSIVEELLGEADRVDHEKDARHGQTRGDEPPAALRSREQRRQALAEAKARLEAERQRQLETGEAAPFEAGIELDEDELRRWRSKGRRSWQREAARQLDVDREQQAAPVPRGRTERLNEAKRRLEQELAVDTQVNAIYQEFHATGRDSLGGRIGKRPNPHVPPVLPEGNVNLTDPDSKLVQDKGLAKIQGYNAQAAASAEGQTILAAEISTRSGDFGNLEPTFDATIGDLRSAGVDERPGTVLADAGYWHSEHTDAIVAAGTQVLIPPESSTRKTPRPGWQTGRFMRAVLASDHGRELYQQRARSIEPTFGQIKHNRGFRQFRRRGRAAARSEWRLITATHNLLKLHQHWIAPATA
ncbi:MAG TPA: transposase [Solirubrobacteraceae bacterium]|nr:transposase [Solirubrobacteraceae bacterium]